VSFIWPEALWLLLTVPVLVVLYVRLVRRRHQVGMRYASLATVQRAHTAGAWVRRHLPPLLFLLALVALLLAVARPSAVVMLPSQQQTILLTMDVSGSMRATDVAPDRLRAAQAAASAFIEDLPRGTRVGVVSFAATAAVVQPPTQRREDAVAAIGRFQLQRGTALGSGIIVALATIFPDAGIEVGALAEGRPPGPDDPALTPVPPGSYASAAVILLTDGQRTTGPDTMEAARLAANMGVRVYTVGIGTTDGETIGFEGWSMRVRLDENALKAIARETRGEYFHAGTAEDLRKVYQGLGSRLVLHEEEAEISALFAAAGAALALVAAFLSLLWFARIL
jgi:Ca-activated chloride channel family protein